MFCLGAEHVWAVNPAFPDDALSPDPGIRCLRTLGEQTSLPDSCADIIWGNALLEHVHDPAALARECRRLLSSRGECFLQGNPLWTSAHGHHNICTAPSGASYRCSDKSVPLAPWEHLLLHDERQVVGIGGSGKILSSKSPSTATRTVPQTQECRWSCVSSIALQTSIR